MFDVAWTEYLLIVVVALVLLGPKELPVVLRTLGRWVSKARHMATTLERQLYTLADNRPSPFSEKNIPLESPLYTYQRVFLKQHSLGLQIFRQINPSPKPWL